MEELCLYEFVKSYTFDCIDSSGNQKYRKLNKVCLPNHQIYDPNKEDEKEAYYYSLLPLFVPFREETNLVKDGQSAKEAFKLFFSTHKSIGDHHEKLIRMLAAQSIVHNINEVHDEDEREIDTEEDIDGPLILGETEAAMNDVRDLDYKEFHGVELQNQIKMFNSDQ